MAGCDREGVVARSSAPHVCKIGTIGIICPHRSQKHATGYRRRSSGERKWLRGARHADRRKDFPAAEASSAATKRMDAGTL